MDAPELLVRICEPGWQVFRSVANGFRAAAKRAAFCGCLSAAMSSMLCLESAEAQQYAASPIPVSQGTAVSQASYHAGTAAYSAPTNYAELLPDRRMALGVNQTPLLDAIRPHVRDSWIQLEYVYARIGHEGGRALGTSIIDQFGNRIRDTSDPFPLPSVDPAGLFLVTGPAVAPTTATLNWDQIDGIRGSFGIPLDDRSWVEGSVFALGEQSQSLSVPRIPPTSPNPIFGNPPVQYIVIPYTVDGQPGSLRDLGGDLLDPSLDDLPVSLIVYDAGFFSDYTINFWSGEVNHVQDLRIPHDGWTLQSIIGWRHEEYSEHLAFGGSFDNNSGYATDGTIITGPLATPQTNRIDSQVHNFRHALQFGIRSEVKQYGITLGIEPKVAFGAALVRTKVRTQNAREPGDLSSLLEDANLVIDDPASSFSSDREIEFAPSAELNLYATYDLTSWLKFRVGYNLRWMGNVGVADQSIRYNTISAEDPTTMPDTLDFVADPGSSSRYISSLTLGGEIIFP